MKHREPCKLHKIDICIEKSTQIMDADRAEYELSILGISRAANKDVSSKLSNSP